MHRPLPQTWLVPRARTLVRVLACAMVVAASWLLPASSAGAATTTISPEADLSGSSGTWTAVGPGTGGTPCSISARWGCVDESAAGGYDDSDYLQLTAAAFGGTHLQNWDLPTFTSGTVVGIEAKLRTAFTAGSVGACNLNDFRLLTTSGTVVAASGAQSVAQLPTISTISIGAYGLQGTQTQLDDLYVEVNHDRCTNVATRVYSVEVDVTYISATTTSKLVPNADRAIGTWASPTCTGAGTRWGCIDDAGVAAGGADYIASTSGGTSTGSFELTNPTVATGTSLDLFVNADSSPTASSCTLTAVVKLADGSTLAVLGPVVVDARGYYASPTVTGLDLDQTAVNGLYVEFTGSATASNACRIYEATAYLGYVPVTPATTLLPNQERSVPGSWGYWGNNHPNYWMNIDEVVPGGVSTGDWVYAPTVSPDPVSFNLTTTTMPRAAQVTIGATLSTNTNGIPATVRLLRNNGTLIGSAPFTMPAAVTNHTLTFPVYLDQSEIDDMYVEVIGTPANPTYVYALSVGVAPATVTGTADNVAICDGTTPVITVAVNTSRTTSVPCQPGTGAWAAAATFAANDIITVYYEGAPITSNSVRGATWVKANAASTSPISNVRLNRQRYRTEARGASAITGAELARWDGVDDPDIRLQSTTAVSTAVPDSGATFEVGVGTFQPGLPVYTSFLWVRAGASYLAGSTELRIYGSGTGTCDDTAASIPLCIAGTLDTGTGTIRFDGTATTAAIPGGTYNNLVLSGTLPTYQLGVSGMPSTITAANFTIQSNALIANVTTNANLSAISVSGAVTLANPASLTLSTATAITAASWTMNNNSLLDIPSASSISVNGNVALNNTATIFGSGGYTFTVGGHLSGDGSVNVTGGTFALRSNTSTVNLAATNMAGSAWRFNNLELSSTSGPHQVVLPASTREIRVAGTLSVGRSGDTQVTQLLGDAFTSNLMVTGSVVTTATSVLNPPQNFIVHGDVTLAGVVTPTTNTGLTIAGTGTSTVTVAASASGSLYRFASSAPNKTIAVGGANPLAVQNSISLTGTSCGEPIHLRGAVPGTMSAIINPNSVGMTSLSYVTVRDMALQYAAPQTVATNSVNLGNLLNVPLTPGGACGPLLPNADRAGSTGTISTVGSAPCAGAARWECVNEPVATPNDSDLLNASGSWTQQFELSSLTLDGVVTGVVLHFRAAAAALPCSVRMRLVTAGGQQLINWAQPLANTYATSYATSVLSGLLLNQADVDGLYVEAGLATSCAGATYLGEVNVDLVQSRMSVVGTADNLAICDGVTPVIGIAVNSTKHSVVPCGFGTGAFAANPSFTTADTVTTYYDGVAGGATNQGATWVKTAAASTTTITDIKLNRQRYRTEARAAGTPITRIDIAKFAMAQDADIQLMVSGVVISATSDTGSTFEIGVNTFQAPSLVSIRNLWVRSGATYDAGSSSTQLFASGSGSCSDTVRARSLCAPGTILPGTSTMIFAPTGGATTIPGYAYSTLAVSASGITTFDLGSSDANSITADVVSIMGPGTGMTTLSTSTYSPNITVGGSFYIAGATLSGSGTGTITLRGDLTGDGNINLTDGVVHLDSATGANTTMAASGTLPGTPWQFATLATSTCGSCLRTVTVPAYSRGFRVSNTLRAQAWSTLDMSAMTQPVVAGNVAVDIGAGAKLPPSLTVSGNYTQIGSTDPGTGTVAFTGSGTSTFQAFNGLYNATMTTPSKTLDLGTTLVVTNNLTVGSGSCLTPFTLKSDVGGSARAVVIGGATASIANARLGDLQFSGGTPSASNSADLGGNANVTFVNPACGSTTSAYTNRTNASAGTVRPTNIDGSGFKMSFVNGSGLVADRYRSEITTSPLDSTVLGLWPFDGSPNDRTSAGNNASLSGGVGYGSANSNFGQALSFDGVDDGALINVPGTFNVATYTVELWMRASSHGSSPWQLLAARSGGSSNSQFQIYGQSSEGDLIAAVSAGGTFYGTGTKFTPFLDNTWHHIAMTVDGSKDIRLYVDGIQYGPTIRYSGTLDMPNVPVRIGGSDSSDRFQGSLDDLQISNYAKSQAELAGYVATARPHAQSVWQSAGYAASGAALSSSCANAARCADTSYASASIHREGARYFVSHQARTTTGFWAAPVTDWFETGSSITVSSPTTVALPAGSPGTDTTASMTATTSCTNATGCDLMLQGTSDTVALAEEADDGSIPHITPASPSAPAAWTAGSPLGLGFTVLSNSGSGAKDTSRWGTGANFSNLALLKFVGATRTPTLLHHSTSAATETTSIGIRLNAPPATPVGTYSGTFSLYAVANP